MSIDAVSKKNIHVSRLRTDDYQYRQKDIVLDIQRELVDEGLMLSETTAGQLIAPSIDSLIGESVSRIKSLERRLETAETSSEIADLQKQKASIIEQKQNNTRRRERLQKRPGKDIAEDVEKKQRAGKWRDRIGLFASILGLVATATVNIILPLAGVPISI
jgi:hypothetical protein